MVLEASELNKYGVLGPSGDNNPKKQHNLQQPRTSKSRTLKSSVGWFRTWQMRESRAELLLLASGTLLCRSFLVMNCLLIRYYNILPNKELRRRPQVVCSIPCPSMILESSASLVACQCSTLAPNQPSTLTKKKSRCRHAARVGKTVRAQQRASIAKAHVNPVYAYKATLQRPMRGQPAV